ncbi:MAG: hypothetical protein IR159_09345 [Brevundimonas sp.]|nr:hypothetical protein [Brevundimonas sp.]
MPVFQSFENAAGHFRIVLLEPEIEGVYVHVFETAESVFPERDYLQDTLQDAMEFCAENFGVPESSWRTAATYD